MSKKKCFFDFGFSEKIRGRTRGRGRRPRPRARAGPGPGPGRTSLGSGGINGVWDHPSQIRLENRLSKLFGRNSHLSPRAQKSKKSSKTCKIGRNQTSSHHLTASPKGFQGTPHSYQHSWALCSACISEGGGLHPLLRRGDFRVSSDLKGT